MEYQTELAIYKRQKKYQITVPRCKYCDLATQVLIDGFCEKHWWMSINDDRGDLSLLDVSTKMQEEQWNDDNFSDRGGEL